MPGQVVSLGGVVTRYTRKIDPSFLPRRSDAPTSVVVSRAMPQGEQREQASRAPSLVQADRLA